MLDVLAEVSVKGLDCVSGPVLPQQCAHLLGQYVDIARLLLRELAEGIELFLRGLGHLRQQLTGGDVFRGVPRNALQLLTSLVGLAELPQRLSQPEVELWVTSVSQLDEFLEVLNCLGVKAHPGEQGSPLEQGSRVSRLPDFFQTVQGLQGPQGFVFGLQGHGQ